MFDFFNNDMIGKLLLLIFWFMTVIIVTTILVKTVLRHIQTICDNIYLVLILFISGMFYLLYLLFSSPDRSHSSIAIVISFIVVSVIIILRVLKKSKNGNLKPLPKFIEKLPNNKIVIALCVVIVLAAFFCVVYDVFPDSKPASFLKKYTPDTHKIFETQLKKFNQQPSVPLLLNETNKPDKQKNVKGAGQQAKPDKTLIKKSDSIFSGYGFNPVVVKNNGDPLSGSKIFHVAPGGSGKGTFEDKGSFINAVKNAKNGDVIYVWAGNYDLGAGQIDLNQLIAIAGSGKSFVIDSFIIPAQTTEQAVIKSSVENEKALFKIHNNTVVVISGLTLVGEKKGGVGFSSNGRGSSGVIINNCTVSGFYNAISLQTSDVYIKLIQNNKIIKNNGDGIVGSKGTIHIVSDNTIDDNKGTGIFLSSGKISIDKNNSFSGNKESGVCSSGADIEIADKNAVNNNGAQGAKTVLNGYIKIGSNNSFNNNANAGAASGYGNISIADNNSFTGNGIAVETSGGKISVGKNNNLKNNRRESVF